MIIAWEGILSSKEPLVEALEKYRKAGIYPLHTPGHKGGRGATASLHSWMIFMNPVPA